MMQTRPAPSTVAAPPPPPPPGLAAVHAEALYRPVPPVDCDADGYPCSDSKTVESTKHGRTADYLGTVMRARYRNQADVCVASDLGLFFERGNRAALLAPDFMIAFGVDGRGDRPSFKIWDEGRVPALALELLSARTWRRDLEVKPGLYRDLGIREYWTVELLGRFSPPIIGRRLRGGVYVEIPPEASGGLHSEVLDLELCMVGEELRFREVDTGAIIPDYTELEDMRRAATRRVAQESGARRSAEARVAALEEELHRLKG